MTQLHLNIPCINQEYIPPDPAQGKNKETGIPFETKQKTVFFNSARVI